MKNLTIRRFAELIAAVIAVCMFFMSRQLYSLNVEDQHFPARITVEGRKLELIGAGVRKKYFFKVYAMAPMLRPGRAIHPCLVKEHH